MCTSTFNDIDHHLDLLLRCYLGEPYILTNFMLLLLCCHVYITLHCNVAYPITYVIWTNTKYVLSFMHII